MAGEWNQTTLGSIAAKDGYGLVDGPFGSNLPASCYTQHGIPVIRGSNLTLGTSRFRAGEFVFVSRETAQRLARSLCRPFDIVFTKKGTLGQTGLVPDGGPYDLYLLSSNQMKLTVDQRQADRLFVYYFVSSSASTRKIIQDSEATGVPKTNVTYLRNFPITLPPLPEQRAIARILGTLDDKIDLNRRMNETLEAMARALFKSWFVDFLPVRANMEARNRKARTQTGDPVRAKAAGRDSLPAPQSEAARQAGGLPKPLADLFPDSFEDSELGEIPKGWEVQRVGGIGSVVCGKTPPTQASEYYGGDVPFITIPDMHGRIFATATQKRLSYAGAESQAKKMLPVGAICVSCIATAGLVVITSEAAQTNQQINTVVPSEKDTTYFWFWSLKNLGDEIRAGGSGGSVLINLSTGRFAELRLLAGLARLRSTYHTIVTPIFGRILANERESRTLAALRDTLLPKLLSGELRVKDAERFVESAI